MKNNNVSGDFLLEDDSSYTTYTNESFSVPLFNPHVISGQEYLNSIADSTQVLTDIFKGSNNGEVEVKTLNGSWVSEFYLPDARDVPNSSKLRLSCNSNWCITVRYNFVANGWVSKTVSNDGYLILAIAEGEWTTEDEYSPALHSTGSSTKESENNNPPLLNGTPIQKYFDNRIKISLLEISDLKKYLMNVKNDQDKKLKSNINKLVDKLDDKEFQIAERLTNKTVNKMFVDELRAYTCTRYQEIDNFSNDVYKGIASTAAEAKKREAVKAATEEKRLVVAATAEEKKRKATNRREAAERAKVSDIVGFFQEGQNKNSQGEVVESHRWGMRDGGIKIQIIGEGAAWTRLHGVGNHFHRLIFSNKVSETDRCITGGIQVCSDTTSKKPWVTKRSWGHHGEQNGRKKQYIGSNKAWSSAYGWGNSKFYIWCNTNVIVGFMQVHTNCTSTAPQIVGRTWGVNKECNSIHKRCIGTGYAWHPQYHWGYSKRYLFIKEK